MLESISLEISNYWTSNDFLTESNKNCGTLVAFDWRDDYLTEINTNIDLDELECDNFKFDKLIEFLNRNNFTFVLGLRNIVHDPSEEWTGIEYDEYVVDCWPSPIPEFDVPDNIFILRYSYDENSKIDKFASTQFLFKDFMIKSDWEKYYKDVDSKEKTRVIVLCSDVENIILHDMYIRRSYNE